jgi:hypothetical protein
MQVALAHERVEIGQYAVVVGWQKEPPIVGERNALLFQIQQGNAPVNGLEATLDAEALYGGRSFRSNLVPTGAPGEYAAEIFPTVRGQYEVRLFGTIGDQAVDQILQPEEVFAADRLQFPETQPDLHTLQSELQTQMDTLRSQLRTTRLLAVGGVGVGLLGLAVALLLRPKKS